MNQFFLTAVAFLIATQASAATTANSASVAAPQTGTTVTAKATSVGAKKSLIKINYTAENSAGVAAANSGDKGALSSIQHVGVAYDLGKERSIQYRQYFYYNSTEADSRNTSEWSMGDHVLRYTDAKLFATEKLPISTEFRLIVGGNKYAREVGQYVLRNDSAIAQTFGKTTVEYGLSTRAYAYSGESAGQQSLRLLPAIDVSYEANKVVSPFANVYTDHRWYRSGTGIATFGPRAGDKGNPADNRDLFNLDIGARMSLGSNVKLNVYGETTTNLRSSASNKDNAIFDQDNTNYMLDLIVTM